MPSPTSILRVDASMRHAGSVTRGLADRLIARLEAAGPTAVDRLDLAKTKIDYVDADWIDANFTAPEERSPAQEAALAGSDALVRRLQAADVLVLSTPIYNFGPPAALKAWIDQIARARVTFRYSETGPVGLLTGKKAVLLMASGGTKIDAPIDFATPYLRHALGFVGIKDVAVIAADGLGGDAAARERADAAVDALDLAGLAV